MVLTIGGGGLAVTGVVLGLIAHSEYNALFDEIDPTTLPDGKPYCTDKGSAMPVCLPDGQPKSQSALFLGRVGTVVGIGGLAFAAVGAYMWFFGPHEPADHHAVSLIPTLAPDAAGLSAVGQF